MLDSDRLGAGIDPPDAYSAAEGWGSTEVEARQGEPLDQMLAEEEPEQSTDTPTATTADRRAGQLLADGAVGASPRTAIELPAAGPEDQRTPEQEAMHVNDGTAGPGRTPHASTTTPGTNPPQMENDR
ncbi:MAG: hypothetical protein ACR2KL_07030 [Nocardioidaceae bacterium]